MDTSYCKGTHGSIKTYRNRIKASNCQCCSIPAYIMQAWTVTVRYKGLGQRVLVSPSLVSSLSSSENHLSGIHSFPLFSILPSPFPLLLSNAFLLSITSLLNHHSFPSWIPSISPPLFTPPPPLPHFIPPLLLQSTMSHSPLYPSISPTYISSVSHLSFTPSVNHV